MTDKKKGTTPCESVPHTDAADSTEERQRSLHFPLARRDTKTQAPLVLLDHGEVWTTSLLIAEKFSKRHKDVLRAIENKPCSDTFRQRNFAPAEYLDDQGKPRRMYRLTRDGFTLIGMGLTGKSAVAWQERFIAAFNKMDREVRHIATNHVLPEWNEARQFGKAERRELTDAVQLLCERAHKRGDSTTLLAMWETAATKTVTNALFEMNGRGVAEIRERLTVQQLRRLAMAEHIFAQAIESRLDSDLHHKTINEQSKLALHDFANLTGGREAPGVNVRAKHSLTKQPAYVEC